MRRLSRYASILTDVEESDFDPLANLFDAAFVFAVALLVAFVSFIQIPNILRQKDYTIVVEPGTPEMKMIVKDGKEIKRYEATGAVGAGSGELLGRAYRLKDGRVVYVPKESEPIYAAPELSEAANDGGK